MWRFGLVILAVAVFLVGWRPSVGKTQEIDAAQLLEWLQEEKDMRLIDVREPYEFSGGHIPGAELVPLGQLDSASLFTDLDKDTLIITVCRSGNRSLQAQRRLTQQGFSNVFSLRGGMLAWPGEVVVP